MRFQTTVMARTLSWLLLVACGHCAASESLMRPLELVGTELDRARLAIQDKTAGLTDALDWEALSVQGSNIVGGAAFAMRSGINRTATFFGDEYTRINWTEVGLREHETFDVARETSAAALEIGKQVSQKALETTQVAATAAANRFNLVSWQEVGDLLSAAGVEAQGAATSALHAMQGTEDSNALAERGSHVLEDIGLAVSEILHPSEATADASASSEEDEGESRLMKDEQHAAVSHSLVLVAGSIGAVSVGVSMARPRPAVSMML